MRFDLAKPCKNCPFGVADTRIRFSCAERAEEIEEQAYRRGFPCHLSATLDEDDEDAGYEFGSNTQHCAGAAIMFLNGGYESWPGIGNRDLPDRVVDRLTANANLAFANVEQFVCANRRPSADDALRELIEAGTECADDLEVEVKDRWGYDERLAHKMERDLAPVKRWRAALAGEEPAADKGD